MVMKASQRQSSASWRSRRSFTLVVPKRRSSKVMPGVGGFSPSREYRLTSSV